MKMLNVHHRYDRYDDAIDLRSFSDPSRKVLEKEWITCPRCKNVKLKPDFLGKDEKGNISIWWTCSRLQVCNFPLDMPPDIFHVQQTPAQAQMGYYPLPKIKSIPEKYRYLYPLTFYVGKYPSITPEPNFEAAGSNGSNDRSDCLTISDSSTELKKTQDSSKSFPKQKETNTEVSFDNSAPSTSGFCEESVWNAAEDKDRDIDLEQEIDLDIEFSTQRHPVRTLKRKNGQIRSWSKLIDSIMLENDLCTEILTMEETQLMQSLSSILEQQKVEEHPVTFSRLSRNVTYKLDDFERAFRQLHEKVDWRDARNRFSSVTQNFDQSIACKQVRSGKELLDVVGVEMIGMPIDVEKMNEEKRKSLEIRVKKVMQKINSINREECRTAAKRRKLANDEAKEEKTKKKTAGIMESAKARILNKMRTKDRESPSIPVHQVVEQPVEVNSDQFDLDDPNPISWTSEYNLPNNPPSCPSTNDNEEFGALNLDGLFDDEQYSFERVHAHEANANQESISEIRDLFDDDPLESHSNNLNLDYENTSLFDEDTFNGNNFGF